MRVGKSRESFQDQVIQNFIGDGLLDSADSSLTRKLTNFLNTQAKDKIVGSKLVQSDSFIGKGLFTSLLIEYINRVLTNFQKDSNIIVRKSSLEKMLEMVPPPDIFIYKEAEKEKRSKAIFHAGIYSKLVLQRSNKPVDSVNALFRKVHVSLTLPKIFVVTIDSRPKAIASFLLYSGVIDGIYHFALHELKEALVDAQNEDQLDMFRMLIEGRRLRDISDLPFDLIA